MDHPTPRSADCRHDGLLCDCHSALVLHRIGRTSISDQLCATVPAHTVHVHHGRTHLRHPFPFSGSGRRHNLCRRPLRVAIQLLDCGMYHKKSIENKFTFILITYSQFDFTKWMWIAFILGFVFITAGLMMSILKVFGVNLGFAEIIYSSCGAALFTLVSPPYSSLANQE